MSRLTRRRFLQASATASLLPWPTLAQSQRAGAHERLWYTRPASRWEEALPIGNGRLGAMIFGRVGQERLQLNEQTLWAGSPYTPDNPEALSGLARDPEPSSGRPIQGGQPSSRAPKSWRNRCSRCRTAAWAMCCSIFPACKSQHVMSARSISIQPSLPLAIGRVRARSRGKPLHRARIRSSFSGSKLRETSSPFGVRYRAPRKVKYISPEYRGPATPPITERAG